MNKNGGYTWIQTCATVVCSVKNTDEQNIICVNYIISARENGSLILDQCQLGFVKREPKTYVQNDNDPKTPDTNDDKSRNAHDVKMNSNHGESKSNVSSVTTSSHEGSYKVAEHSVQNCDDDTTPASTASKRGRKRKVKSEVRDDPPSDNTSSLSQNRNSVAEASSEISVKDIDSNPSSDFTTDLLLRHASGQDKSQFAHGNSHFPQQSASMPATALLRQLYVNRESVIRATTRPENFMFPDSSQQSLPTPPNDSYDSQYLRKPGDGYSNLIPSYGAYPSMEYNNAMTPPSSVSPRDLSNQKGCSAYDFTNLTNPSGDSRVHYPSNPAESNALPHLPLKPQPYALHQMDPTYNIDHQSQYFSYHPSFHLYASLK
jgi:neuronal PAS domain-containing protein 1/3